MLLKSKASLSSLKFLLLNYIKFAFIKGILNILLKLSLLNIKVCQAGLRETPFMKRNKGYSRKKCKGYVERHLIFKTQSPYNLNMKSTCIIARKIESPHHTCINLKSAFQHSIKLILNSPELKENYY